MRMKETDDNRKITSQNFEIVAIEVAELMEARLVCLSSFSRVPIIQFHPVCQRPVIMTSHNLQQI